MKYVVSLKSGTVIDRSLFNKKNDEIAKVFNESLFNDHTVDHGETIVVDSITAFFSKPSLDKILTRPETVPDWEKKLKLILEYREVSLDTLDVLVEQINKYLQMRNMLSEVSFENAGGYIMVAVPDNYDVTKRFTFYDQKILDRNTNYSTTTKTAKKLWELASKIWHEWDSNGKNETKPSMRASWAGYTRSAIVRKESVEIGCQTFKRHEVEQIALHMGWEFP
jgi:hypothetical protein